MIPSFKKYLNESVWMDIHKRSNNDVDRKEEDVNLLDGLAFYKYLVDRYKIVTDKIPSYETHHYNAEGDIIQMPVLYYPKRTYKEGNNKTYHHCIRVQVWDINKPEKTYVLVPTSMLNRHEELADKLEKTYWVVKDNAFWSKVFPKNIKEKVTNKFIIEVIDFILANPNPYKIVVEKQ